MKAAATFLLSVTVFTALFLESSTNPLESAADVDVMNTLIDSLAPIENAIATAASLKAKVRNAVDAAAATINNDLNTELLRNALQKITAEKIKSSDAALAVVKSAVDEGLAKTKDKLEIEVLTNLNVYLVEFGSMSSELHDVIRAAVASGTREALESVIASINNAIEDTEKNLANQVEILEATPGKRVSRVKVVVETEFATIIANAKVVAESTEKAVAAW